MPVAPPGGKTSPATQPIARLYDGREIPIVGLGTWKSKSGEVTNAVYEAVRAGYRHMDCAAAYQNEQDVGDGLERAFKEGISTRKEVWITSKLFEPDHAAEDVPKALKKSLSELKLDYLDLYLMHWPVTTHKGPTLEPPIKETWQAMEKLVDQGLTKHIGVSNFSIKKLKDLLSYARIKPVINQVESHPYFRNDALISWCKENGIHVTAYSPLGSADSASMFSREAPVLMKEPVIKVMAKKYGKSEGQILIRWGIQRGTSVIPKSVHKERIIANLDVFDWELSQEDFKTLSTLPTQVRMCNGTWQLSPEGPYKTLAQLWDEPTLPLNEM